MVFGGRDLKCCFYIFSLPCAWWPLFVIDEPVEGHLVGRPELDLAYVCLCVIPMGWVSAVAACQYLHHRVLRDSPQAPLGSGTVTASALAQELYRCWGLPENESQRHEESLSL